MSMRVRDLQQYLGKFTDNEKGTAISNCHLYIETESGHLEEIRKIEIQENNSIFIVLKLFFWLRKKHMMLLLLGAVLLE